MTPTRRKNLEALEKKTGCNIVVVTKDNLKHWEVPHDPIHPAYTYLSAVHRSDYLRGYFMHHYGGGYHDVKEATGPWAPYFDYMERHPECWVVGYAEGGPNCIAGIDDKVLYEKMCQVYSKMVGNGAYICRKGSALTREWFTEVHRTLHEKYKQLQNYPAPHPRAMAQEDPKYALKWTEICGNVFHPLVYKYLDYVVTGLPKPVCHGYQ